MKITVINGNTRHGSTWHCVDLLRQELSRYSEIEMTEFSLPKDMPHFCNGCFSCIYNGEHTCPHSAFVSPIVTAMEKADLIIMTSPIYGLDVSGQMKALIDHLCFMWMSHRPNPKMFNKVGLTVSTTAGAGLKHTTRTMKSSLTFWGVKRVYCLKNAVAARKWNEVSEKRQMIIKKQVKTLAKQIYKTISNIDRKPSPIFRSIFFSMMVGMMKKNNWNETDRRHWEENGWLDGKKPYKKSS